MRTGRTLGRTLISLGLLICTLSLAAAAQNFTVIHNFTGGSDGANPYAGITLDQGGNLYGTSTVACGNVFKMKQVQNAWILSNLVTFQGQGSDCSPQAKVVFGPNGALYGTTVFGGPLGQGTVFELRPPLHTCATTSCPWLETMLYSFQGGSNDGASPSGDPVVFDPAGNLYGTTTYGGIFGCNDGTCGTAYELSPSNGSWAESIIYLFGYDQVALPHGVTIGSDGRLYGTTYLGGSTGVGTVFQLTNAGGNWSNTTLYSFSGDDGSFPWAGVIRDQQGNSYGATGWGGANHAGTIFKIDSAGNFSVLYTFTNPGLGGILIGPGPAAKLMMDAAGNLYGTTYADGAYGFGSVFKLSPSDGGWTYTSLHEFTGGADGGNPISDVVMDASGNLYGTANGGGNTIGLCYQGLGCGVVWEITP